MCHTLRVAPAGWGRRACVIDARLLMPGVACAPRGPHVPLGTAATSSRLLSLPPRPPPRDPERLAAPPAHDRRLREDRRDDAHIAAAVADRLDADASSGGAVPGGRAAEAAGRVGGGRGRVGLEGALQPLDGRAVAPLRLGVERDQGEATAGMRLLRVVQAQLLGDREKSAVVVSAGARGVSDSTRGGDAVDCFMKQSLEREFVSAGGRRLSDQGLRRGKIGQLGVVPLNVGPRLCQLCGENRWCRAHVVTTSRSAPVFLFRAIPNNLHVPVSCR